MFSVCRGKTAWWKAWPVNLKESAKIGQILYRLEARCTVFPNWIVELVLERAFEVFITPAWYNKIQTPKNTETLTVAPCPF